MSATWDLETITKVRDLNTNGYLTFEFLADADKESPKELASHLIELLIDQGRAINVELDPRDMELTIWKDEIRGAQMYKATWAPSTKDVELRGGGNDGEHWTVPAISSPLYLPPRPVKGKAKHLTTTKVKYLLAGWHEAGRCWIFDLQNEPLTKEKT